MPGQLRTIRRRIRSIQSTAKITRAMELVAASKMRRAQLNALAGRPYAEKMRFVLADLAETLPLIDPEARHPLLRHTETLAIDYIYEPDRETVLAELLPRYIERQVYEATLESIASEQSARMVAMRNATDNANDLMKDLTLVYNKARQESITSELLDITGGVEALQKA